MQYYSLILPLIVIKMNIRNKYIDKLFELFIFLVNNWKQFLQKSTNRYLKHQVIKNI
jgi:hypothetical protein